MKLEIELRPHVGKKMTVLGEVDVEFDQYMIFAIREDGTAVHVGFVHKKPVVTDPKTGRQFKTPINWLPVIYELPAEVVDKMATAVQAGLAAAGEEKDGELAASGQTRPVNMPPNIPDEPEQTAASNSAAADDENL